jgi:hypothetical protein
MLPKRGKKEHFCAGGFQASHICLSPKKDKYANEEEECVALVGLY